ncbi:MAG: HD domain-containing protein [Candidatus Anammoximicrobium sp.]|nr:HD domain-containing protein [Candidatus Anammoximicrobium sp.]
MLSRKFDDALQYATLIHAGQTRKGTDIPYLSHLLGVASIAMEHGADEDETIAALLHDAGEDAGGEPRINDIRQRFGNRVADIVECCTDTLETPKPDWRKRKEKYIARLPQESASARLVSAADKLHNARAILRDFRIHGESLWTRFRGGKEGTLWYYRELVKAFRRTDLDVNKELTELIDELDRVTSELHRLATV